MADNIITLVLVKHEDDGKLFLFRAPLEASWKLEVGMYVTVETIHGIQLARVVDFHTAYDGSAEYKFAVACADAYEPLQKVIGIFKPLNYGEEESEENNG